MRDQRDTNIPYKIYLSESEMPTQWYNVRADMQHKPAPLLNPATLQPMTPEELSHVFCDELVAQELDDTTAYFDIPKEILDFYKMYRPSPLVRTASRRNCRRPRRFTISLRAITRAAATN